MNKVRTTTIRTALTMLPLLFASGGAWATDITSKQYIGDLRAAEGRILVDRGGREVFGRRGMRVFKKDVIRASSEAKGAVVFRDETSVRFGPDTTLTLDDFEYAPQEKRFLLHSGVLKGVAVVVSGAVPKSAPETFAMTTPKGTIGIRGTKFTVKVEE